MTSLLHELVYYSAQRNADAPALRFQGRDLSYGALARDINSFANGLARLGLGRHDRVAIYLDKRPETVIAMFGTAAADGVCVPVNPLLKPEQVAYILRDCNVRALITSADRFATLVEPLAACHDLRAVVQVGAGDAAATHHAVVPWADTVSADARPLPRRAIDTDMAAIVYTSGSTGKPKGVVLSHRNMVAGAKSVAQYLENEPADRVLAVLPFSFDYGFSQLSTAFHAGACAVLINYLLPRDVVTAVARERITGLAAVPPLWIQLAPLDWPASVPEHLRYITSSGGPMPRTLLQTLRAKLPTTKIFSMYGLTEAFRSTYLPPSEIDRRPDSIGKAIPNAEILVVRPDGSRCAPGEPGELVHRGALVAMGYWNDPAATAERFRPAPMPPGGVTVTELAVWSGDTVRMDEDGFLYFIGRRDDMIKTSGYRVSPTEIEEVLYATGMVAEAAAFGVPDERLGHAIVVAAKPANSAWQPEALLAECKRRLPAYMVPARIETRDALPRNPNGKIDRKALAKEYGQAFKA